MKILNFDLQSFEEFLEKETSKFLDNEKSCLVLGIREGGMPLGKIVTKKIESYTSGKVHFVGITCLRSSNKFKKNKIVNFILKKIVDVLPKILINKLRNLEYSILINKKNLNRKIIIPNNINYFNYDKILIVDDAVDTGATLNEVLKVVNQRTNSSIPIATLTVVLTNTKAMHIPDYYLYSNVLIRFPWSLDG